MPLVDPRALDTAIQSIQTTPLSNQTFYRCVKLETILTLGLSPLDGTHAGAAGVRYNPPPSAPITYLAGTQALSVLETEHMRLITGPSLATPSPTIICSAVVQNANVVDLTNSLVCAHLGITDKQSEEELLIPTSQW